MGNPREHYFVKNKGTFYDVFKISSNKAKSEMCVYLSGCDDPTAPKQMLNTEHGPCTATHFTFHKDGRSHLNVLDLNGKPIERVMKQDIGRSYFDLAKDHFRPLVFQTIDLETMINNGLMPKAPEKLGKDDTWRAKLHDDLKETFSILIIAANSDTSMDEIVKSNGLEYLFPRETTTPWFEEKEFFTGASLMIFSIQNALLGGDVGEDVGMNVTSKTPSDGFQVGTFISLPPKKLLTSSKYFMGGRYPE